MSMLLKCAKNRFCLIKCKSVIQTPNNSYQLVNNLLCKTSKNPMPESSSYSLCEEFSDFFMKKIISIQNDLQQYSPFEPSSNNRSSQRELLHFSQFWEDEVHRLVSEMKTKTCELDPLPAALLGRCQDVLILIYICILSLSINL